MSKHQNKKIYCGKTKLNSKRLKLNSKRLNVTPFKMGELPIDVLFEIWKLCSTLEKRSLGILSRPLSQRDQVKQFGEKIKFEIRKPQRGDLLSFDAISRTFCKLGSHSVFFCGEPIGGELIGGFANLTPEHEAFVYSYTDKQRLAIRNWLRTNMVYHVQDFPKLYSTKTYFWFSDSGRPYILKIMNWLYLYGKMKSIGEF